MRKKLSEMSLNELWQLFPIFLTEHHACWKEWYAEEQAGLKRILPRSVRISHIGSTAIYSIWAKPIVDILLEAPLAYDLQSIKTVLIRSGYICMSQAEERMSFNKGYTENGFAEKVFHLHIRYEGDNDELYFRDYLNDYPAIAKEYEKLKLSLWKAYEHDRDGYTKAKTEFVTQCTCDAKRIYGKKY